MSIKLMKQRWLVKEADDKKDSTEIVDMDVDEKDEYEIVSEMEKPANFATQRDVENEEPETIGINIHAQENVASLELKRPSRWDVGAPFCIPLNDALASNTNETIVKKCSTGLDGARNGAYNKTINENENEKIFTNETAALKIPGIKIEKYAKNAKTFIATEHEDEIGNHINLSLDKIALPCNPYDIALPPEPSELNDSADCSLLSRISEDKHDSETTSDKEKVIIKWKFTKTPKELLTGDVKIWEPDVERHELSNLHPGKQSKSVLRYAKTSLDTRTASGSLNFDADKGSIHPELLFQRHADHREIGLPPCSLELKSNFHSQNNATLLSTQDQSDYVMHKMKCLENQNVKQNIAPQEASEEANEEQSISNENLRSNWSNISETVLSCSKLQCNHDLGKVTIMDDGSEATKETNVQKTVTSWFATHFSQELHLKETKSSPELISSLQQQWNMDVSKTGTNREDEQDSSPSSASSATSVSMYSFNSTPKTLLSLDLGNLQTTEEQENYSKSVGVINANLTGSANDESLVVEARLTSNKNEGDHESVLQISSIPQKLVSQPSNYEQLDENIILCDESLIKEAKVVRCFCEPTSEEIAESRGCSSGCINRELYTECGSRCPSGMGCANRRFHNKQYAKVEVFNAGVKGWGLRAAEPLEPGRFIIEYVGEVIDAEEMIRRGRRYGKDPKHVHHYLMALKNGAVIDATAKGNVSRFINHSCDPNCESQKWTVDRQLRVGFFAIKPITLGEEIVFDYQLERYGRKAQRCFCGAANCRGRIGDNSESEEGEEDKASDEVEGSETDDEVPLAKRKLKLEKKEKNFHITKKKRRQSSAQRCNKAIINALSRGPPRNRTQVRDLVRLMVQVEQAPQRSSLIQCIRFAHPDVLRLFIQESGLRLLYVFLATDYPIDDEQSVLQLQIKSLDLLDVMPIMNRNQIIDSHLASTVEKIASKKGPVDEIVEDVVRKLVDAACCDMPSTSKYSASTLSKDPDFVIECLHYEMVTKAAKLMGKWSDLREEYRIPRRERTDPVPAQHDISRYVRKTDEDEKSKRVIVDKKDDGSTLWRLSGFGPPPKKRCFDRRRLPKTDLPIFVKDLTHLENKDFKQSPVTTFDSSRINEDDERENRPRKRHSRFDIVGERNPSSMYELYAADCDSYAPPPPKLLPEALFAAGLPDSVNFLYDEHSFPEFFDWNTVYAKYDPSSAAYQQFIDYYQQQQYSMMGMLPCALTPQNAREMTNILEAPSPPPPKQPKTPEENPNMLIIGPIDVENPTDEDIEMLEKHLIMLKGKRAEIRKHLQEVQKGVAQESNDMNSMPPPPPPSQTKQSLWIQATTEEGAVYYYNKETRESVWTLPDESEGGNASADTTTDRIDTRATFKVEIVKYVGGMLEPIRKLKFASSDDYKYVLRKLTHTILEKELKRVGETELKVTESVRDKARKFVAEYLARLGDVFISIPLETSIRTSILARLLIPKRSSEQEALRFTLFRNDRSLI
ncbi:Histone-lysine N-methyltransferase SETD2 [Dirofilaria immitis]